MGVHPACAQCATQAFHSASCTSEFETSLSRNVFSDFPQRKINHFCVGGLLAKYSYFLSEYCLYLPSATPAISTRR